MHFKTSIALYIFALLSFFAVYFYQIGHVRQFLTSSSYGSSTFAASPKLLSGKFTPLPLGSIRPTQGSWLERELQNSANGLAGHLWDFYAFVKDSPWLGGDSQRGEYSELHEGFPYWFNGLVALAYSLADVDEAARLKAQVHAAAEIILDAQADDGWLGPETLESGQRLLWGRFPLLIGLTSLVEANSSAWEQRIMPKLWGFVQLAGTMLRDRGKGFVPQGLGDKNNPRSYSYGRVRVADFMLTLQWMLERGADKEQEAILWECMETSYKLSMKWEAWYSEATYIKDDLYRVPDDVTKPNYAYLHGVNIAQGLKTPMVVYRFTRNSSLLQTAHDAVDWTFRYHGAASGTILADERIDGLSPYSGSELCTTVEAIFSMAYIYHALGRNEDADRAELLAFNALPVMLTEDHWAHQYVTQPNQPWSTNLSTSPFFDTNSQSQTFGLEPHYPCCTVNHPQGLPKFLAGSWAKIGESGVAHVLLSPGTVKFDGVRVQCRTQYPFDETFEYTIDAEEPFEFYLRVPRWASKYGIVESEHNLTELGYLDAVTGLTRIDHRDNDTVAIYHGALLYALEVKHTVQSTTPKAYNNQSAYPESYALAQARDFVFVNASAWNIAIDPSTLAFSRRDEPDLADPIWTEGGPPTSMTALGCEIAWPLFKNVVPGAPLPLEDRVCLRDPVTVKLVPLGSAPLHMVELPIIHLGMIDRS